MIDPVKLECFRDVVSIVCDMRGYPVDKGMGDIIVGLWLHGLWTNNSCWGHENRIEEYGISSYPFVGFPRDDWTFDLLSKLTQGFELIAMREGDQEKGGWIRLYPAEYGNKLDYYRQLYADKQLVLEKLKEWQAEFTRFAQHLIETAE